MLLERFITVWEAKVLKNVKAHYDLLGHISCDEASVIKDIVGDVSGRIDDWYHGNYPEDLKAQVDATRELACKYADKMVNGVFHATHAEKLKNACVRVNDLLEGKF